MIWILVFVSALAWAGFDVGRKCLVAHLTGAQALHLIMTVQLCVATPLLLIGASVDLPRSSVWSLLFPPLPGPPGWEYFGLLALVSLFNLAANLLFVRSVQLSPLSLTTPYLSFTPVFAALVSWLLFGEKPSGMSATGIVIVASGAFVLNPGQNYKKDLLAPFKALLNERGSLLMVLVALLFSVMPIIDKQAVAKVTPLLHTSAAGLIMASIYGLWASRSEAGFRGTWRLGWEHRSWLIFSVLVAFIAMNGQNAALASGAGVAIVESVKRAFGVIGAVVLGWLVFAEQDIARRVLGAVVMSLGVALVLLGR